MKGLREPKAIPGLRRYERMIVMKKENMKNAYGTPSDGFHHKVMNTLYHLDDKKAKKYVYSKRIMRVALVCAVTGAIAFTAAAASTGFFGLNSKSVGKYGVNITTTSDANESTVLDDDHMNYHDVDICIKDGYLPQGFETRTPGGKGGFFSAYLDGNIFSESWYFYIIAYKAEDYNITDKFVVKTEETEFNGHKAVINTKKISEESDRVTYIVTEYFDEENTILRAEFHGDLGATKYFEPDYDEMLRIMENISIERVPLGEIEFDNYNSYSVVSGYFLDDLIMKGKTRYGTVGTPETVKTADYCFEESELTFKVLSITEQTTAEGFDRMDFLSPDDKSTAYDFFFDKNGNFISEYTYQKVDEYGDGLNSLSQTHEETCTRKFYRAQIEFTAVDADIENIYHIVNVDACGIRPDGDAYKGDEDKSLVELIADKVSSSRINKGETVVLDLGFFVDTEAENEACISITVANDYASDAQAVIYRVKE